MGEIRAATVLPADRRPVTLTHRGRAPPGRRAGAAAGRARSAATLIFLHPLPTARRHDGQPPAAQGRVPAARAGRSRRAAVQHPRDQLGRGDQRGRVRRRRVRAARRGCGGRLRGGCGPAPALAARLVVRAPNWRSSGAARNRPWRAPSCCRPRCSRAADSDLDRWAASGKPLLALVPELDDYLRPDEAAPRFARVPQARMIAVARARHLWVGEPYVRIVLNEIVRRVNPPAWPLPTDWKD